jgi:MerR family copper efflux transcriptional regulator
MPAATKTLAQAAAAAGVTRKAIRVYEARGLLTLAERTVAGYRLFTDTDIDTLAFIRRARTLGLRLDDIGDILAIRKGGIAPCDIVNALIDARLHDIGQAITDLQLLRATLTDIRNRPQLARATSPICTIIEYQPDASAD